MREWQGKRYWLVGASEGIGREVARVMSRAGAELVLSARSDERLEELAEELPGKARVLPLDVTSAEAVTEAAREAGEIDGLVYLAGAYWPMPSQEWNAEQAEIMGEVNFLGALRCVGAAIGPMVERDRGHIVLVGSLSGFRGLPGAIGYSASKAGVMALAESMHADLRGTGVDVQLVNPGFVRTRLTDKNDFEMPFIMDPGPAAQEVFDHMNSDGFKKSFPLLFSLLFRGSQFLPDWAYYRLFGRG